ncbi:MAG: hypothetical protein A2V70_14625 [Planctomycetes bacterium RBG_13_63_9]|nr:MAG: hypothetical protein A2V70_14625 [Planctomycetes bacterium RBG_13_63_9]
MVRQTSLGVALLVLLCGNSPQAVGTVILDQVGPAGGPITTAFAPLAEGLQQEITAGLSGTLQGIELLPAPWTGPSTSCEVFVNVGSPWQTDVCEFAETITLDSADSGDWLFIDPSSAGIALTKGERFVIGVRPTKEYSASWDVSGYSGAQDAYASGQLFSDGLLVAGEADYYDVAFRTYVAVTPDPLPGDTDFDGDVDFGDFNALANHYTGSGGKGMRWVVGDFDGDGDVDFADFNVLANHYTGAKQPPVTPHSPEPSTFVIWSLLAALGMTVGRWRRRK